MNEKNRKWIRNYKFEIILTSLVVIVILLYELYFGWIVVYIAGLKGNLFYAEDLMLWFFLLFVLFIILLLIALIHLILIIIKVIKLKKINWLKTLFSLCPFIVCIVLFVSPKAGAVYFLQGYEKWVQKEVDIASIQKWLISLDGVYSEKEYFEPKDFLGELPEAVTKLEPYHMYFNKFETDYRSVEFEWGSGFGHWGIKIGLPGMETPKEGRVELSDKTLEFRRPISSGVYIFMRD